MVLISEVLQSNRSEDTDERLANIGDRLCGGKVPEVPEALPQYVGKGVGSWKFEATGIDSVDDGHRPVIWSEAFEESDYRKFHDAVKQHRAEVTQFLLPSFGIRLA